MKYIFLPILILSTLIAFAQEPTGLNRGDKAPHFEGLDQNNNIVSLAALLTKGPVVLVFYRGEWCPHCNKHLSAIQDSLPYILDRGARVVAVAPEIQENSLKTAKNTGAKFSLIHDDNYKIMRDYDVAFTVDDKTVKRYKKWGIYLDEANGDDSNTLPITATYIIGQDGIIKWVHFDTNYKYQSRASVKQMLEQLY